MQPHIKGKPSESIAASMVCFFYGNLMLVGRKFDFTHTLF